MEKRIIYKNHFGEHNILITETIGAFDKKMNVAHDREFLHSHLWIDDGVVVKCHINDCKLEVGDRPSNEYISELLSVKEIYNKE